MWDSGWLQAPGIREIAELNLYPRYDYLRPPEVACVKVLRERGVNEKDALNWWTGPVVLQELYSRSGGFLDRRRVC